MKRNAKVVVGLAMAFSGLTHAAPPTVAVDRFLSESPLRVLLGYIQAGNFGRPNPKQQECMRQTAADISEILSEWNRIAVRTVFENDQDGQQLDEFSNILSSPEGKLYGQAHIAFAQDLVAGVPMNDARNAMNARMAGLPSEIRRPYNAVSQVIRVASNPRNFRMWPGYDEWAARMASCESR